MMPTGLDELVTLLDLEPLEVNLFRGRSPETPQQRVFGGQVAAQALVAAGRTVAAERPVHSLHAYFLRPGDPGVPIVYDVDRIRDGKSFTTRRVVAIQHGKAIFNLAASFQIVEPGPDHAMEMPAVPDPDDLPTYRERLEPFVDKFSPEILEWLGRERPIDERSVETPRWLESAPRAPAQNVWIRANGSLPEDPLLHACVVAYASDMSLLNTAMLPHAIGFSGKYLTASLDHAMWFHRPFRADEWLLFHEASASASGARGIALGYVFRRDGALAITAIQEGLIRPASSS
jgi:acyl-CoA thioesterase-2